MSVASAGSPRRQDQGWSPPRPSSQTSTTKGGDGKTWDLGGGGESSLEATDGEVLLSAHEMVERLSEVEVHVMVNVFLIGFNERGRASAGGGASGAGAGAAGPGAADAEKFVALDAADVQAYLGELARGLSTDGAGGVPITVVRVGGLIGWLAPACVARCWLFSFLSLQGVSST